MRFINCAIEYNNEMDVMLSRREFLKNIGLTGGGLLLSASPWLSAFSQNGDSGESCPFRHYWTGVTRTLFDEFSG